jgi:uncharacterized protein (DUF1800 family)
VAWTEAHVRRLFWRAGFGATPAEATHYARMGQAGTLRYLLDGDGGGDLNTDIPAPRIGGAPLDPVNEPGHDVLWWLDRMVRSRRPLVEKLTLFWHDHFATANQDTPLMLAQNQMLRDRSLDTFLRLVEGIMDDPAIQLYLSLAGSPKGAPNENFARELMELFTLGSGYSEGDVREMARALTGWRRRRVNGIVSTYWDPAAHDDGQKTIFGQVGPYGPDDVIVLVTTHPAHAPFLVAKLWAFFVTEPLDPGTASALQSTYLSSGQSIKALVGAILAHPALYARLEAPDMVKWPAVAVAGALRTTGSPVSSRAYARLMTQMGQRLFRPPSVAGWDWGPAWLSTNAMHARVQLASTMVAGGSHGVRVRAGRASADWTPAQHLDAALQTMGRPWIARDTRAILLSVARDFADGHPTPARAVALQRLLCQLVLAGPDAQVC